MDVLPSGHSDAVLITWIIVGAFTTLGTGVITLLTLFANNKKQEAEAAAARMRAEESAKLTALHRDLMAAKLDANTQKTEQTAVNTEKIVEKITAAPAHIDVTVKTETP